MGNPQRIPRMNALTAYLLILKTFSNILPAYSVIQSFPLDEINISETIIKGNKDGTIESAHIFMASRTAAMTVFILKSNRKSNINKKNVYIIPV